VGDNSLNDDGLGERVPVKVEDSHGGAVAPDSPVHVHVGIDDLVVAVLGDGDGEVDLLGGANVADAAVERGPGDVATGVVLSALLSLCLGDLAAGVGLGLSGHFDVDGLVRAFMGRVGLVRSEVQERGNLLILVLVGFNVGEVEGFVAFGPAVLGEAEREILDAALLLAGSVDAVVGNSGSAALSLSALAGEASVEVIEVEVADLLSDGVEAEAGDFSGGASVAGQASGKLFVGFHSSLVKKVFLKLLLFNILPLL